MHDRATALSWRRACCGGYLVEEETGPHLLMGRFLQAFRFRHLLQFRNPLAVGCIAADHMRSVIDHDRAIQSFLDHHMAARQCRTPDRNAFAASSVVMPRRRSS